MTRLVDERLFGSWIPDPGQADSERWASMEISPAGWFRFVVREGPGLRTVEHEYRVPSAGNLRIEETDGTWTEQRYTVDDGPVLVMGGRRFVPALDPAARPWPAAVAEAASSAATQEPTTPEAG
jgi:hypothetical protein